ncbi:hypothetical protein KAU45_00975 [bacterium]|nr:hypothetical protein [bacterium]
MITYTLDYNGNVVQSHRVDAGGQLFYTYTYDYTDRMTHLAIDDNPFPPVSEMEMLCGYDAGGLRMRREITDNVEETVEERRYIYDQNDLLIAEYLWDGDSWELSREYVNDANGVVCTIDYDYRDRGSYELGWHLKDHLGSTRVVCKDQAAFLCPGYDYRM